MSTTETDLENQESQENQEAEFDGRKALRELAAMTDEWAGIPMPLDDHKLIVEDRYPYKAIQNFGATDPDRHKPRVCLNDDVDERTPIVRNTWRQRVRSRVWVVEDENGIHAEIDKRRPYADRLNMTLNTIGASFAWDLKAELEALDLLATMISGTMMQLYMLTGSFLEVSKRSRVTYIFRKARPTIAMAPVRRWGPNPDDALMKAIAVLCLHPIAFYEETWAGAMVPTDDVIAHLLMMRGDEHMFWRRANQHDPEETEAGI